MCRLIYRRSLGGRLASYTKSQIIGLSGPFADPPAPIESEHPFHTFLFDGVFFG